MHTSANTTIYGFIVENRNWQILSATHLRLDPESRHRTSFYSDNPWPKWSRILGRGSMTRPPIPKGQPTVTETMSPKVISSVSTPPTTASLPQPYHSHHMITRVAGTSWIGFPIQAFFFFLDLPQSLLSLYYVSSTPLSIPSPFSPDEGQRCDQKFASLHFLLVHRSVGL